MKKKSAFLLYFFFLCIYNCKAQPVLSLTPVITSNLSAPMQLVHAGDGSNRIFIVEKSGSIKVFSSTYSYLGTFLTVTNITNTVERGLLSMAFHPNYKQNGFFFVFYTDGDGNLEIARYQVSASPNIANPGSKVILITIPHTTYANHNGGEMHFGKDGYLYLSTGDGGGAGDPDNLAQNTQSLLGKMLRFNVNTSPNPPYYSLPVDNPFNNEVYAYGLRNPFRWSFDRLNGAMWIGDVGQYLWEEISYSPADSSKGANYGWRCYEGFDDYDQTVGCIALPDGFRFPLYVYPNTAPSSVTGGTVYRGNTYVSLRGIYLAADFYSGKFYKILYDTLTHTSSTSVQTLLLTSISDFGETEDGEMYVVSLSNNSVHRIRADGPKGYTFTGNGNWDLASNWSDNTIPPAALPAGAEIIINPATDGTCFLNVPQTIGASAKIIVMPGKKFEINGNLVIQ